MRRKAKGGSTRSRGATYRARVFETASAPISPLLPRRVGSVCKRTCITIRAKLSVHCCGGTGARAKAWCLSIHAKAFLSLSLSLSAVEGGSVEYQHLHYQVGAGCLDQRSSKTSRIIMRRGRAGREGPGVHQRRAPSATSGGGGGKDGGGRLRGAARPPASSRPGSTFRMFHRRRSLRMSSFVVLSALPSEGAPPAIRKVHSSAHHVLWGGERV